MLEAFQQVPGGRLLAGRAGHAADRGQAGVGAHKQSSERICVEHASAEFKQWRPLQGFTGRRDDFEETFLATGGPVPDRAAER